MKLYQGLAALFLAMALSTGVGYAQDEEGVIEPSQTGLTTAELKTLDSQGDPKARANKAMKIANQKIKEARKNAQNGDAAATANAVRGYETALGRAMSSIEEGEGQGVDMTNTIDKVGDATLKHQTTLDDVFDRIPEQAQPHIMHAMEVSARGHENALNALENAAARQSNSQRQGRVLLDVASGRVAQAQAAAARGDEASAQRAGEGYARALNGSMRAFSNTGQGADFESVLNRVANATEKHQDTLQDVMGRVPEQAQGAIQKALDASQRGHETASTNLQRARQQRLARQQQAGVQGRSGRRGDGTVGAGRGSVGGVGGAGGASGASGGGGGGGRAPGRRQ